MKIGKTYVFTVDRETKLGYVLEKDGEEFFLHHNECNGNSFIPGDKAKAFLYVDKKNRIAATLFKPLLEVGETKLLTVTDVNKNLGIFFNIGISKDILLSAEDLPKDDREWPKVGDKVPCELKIKANRLALKIANKPEILRLCEKEVRLNKNAQVTGYVYRMTPEGINLVTDDYEVIFIYKNNFRNRVHLGEALDVKIIDIHETDYSGTLNKNKEYQIDDDLVIILDYLYKNNGVMMITEKSSPELISKLFNMSKTAFKNAIGRLLKQDKIEILENKIILKNVY